jgi:hypothetical protein
MRRTGASLVLSRRLDSWAVPRSEQSSAEFSPQNFSTADICRTRCGDDRGHEMQRGPSFCSKLGRGRRRQESTRRSGKCAFTERVAFLRSKPWVDR